MPLVMFSSISTVIPPAFWTRCSHRSRVSDRCSFPWSTSCRITVPVKVLVMLPIRKCVAGVTGWLPGVVADPAACCQPPPPPSTTTAPHTPGRPGRPAEGAHPVELRRHRRRERGRRRGPRRRARGGLRRRAAAAREEDAPATQDRYPQPPHPH